MIGLKWFMPQLILFDQKIAYLLIGFKPPLANLDVKKSLFNRLNFTLKNEDSVQMQDFG